MSTPGSSSTFTQARLTRDLPPEMLVLLDALGTEQAPPAGSVLVAAGSVSAGLYFVVSGSVEIVTTSAVGPDAVVARLGPGEVVGELSAFTGEPAIADARVAEAETRVQFLRLDDLNRHPAGLSLQQHLIRSLISNSQERLARTNAGYAEQLRAAQTLLAERRMAARFLLLVLVLSSLSTLICHWIQVERTVDIYAPAFAWCYLLVLGVPTGLLAWWERLPPRFFGITTENLGRDLAWSSAIVVGVSILVLGVLVATGYPLAENVHPEYLLRHGPLYFLHSAVQEFIGRGVLLGLMLRLFGDNTRASRIVGNAAMSFMFGMTHLHFGMGAVVITTVVAFGLGAYYLWSRNLAGPILIHGCLGLGAFMLGLL
jgi:CRP-like cAMP-binding protein